MQRIRIPTPDAPAAHHLTFICAVAELAHRVIENVTGLNVDLHVGVHQHINVEREPALTAAAAAAGLRYSEYNGTNWHSWEIGGDTTRVTIYGKTKPAAPPAVRHLCEYDDCEDYALPGDDWCAEHKAEHDQLMAEELEPETTTELAQAVTAQLESATLAAQYTAANDARQEG